MSFSYMRSVSACRSVSAMEALREAEAERMARPCMRRIEPGEYEIEELPLMQQLAILQMMHSTLARGVAKRLSSVNGCQTRSSHFDYRALVAKGFAYRSQEDRWHTLTPEGWIFARAMLPRLCREQGIHIMQNQEGKGCTYFKCSCGQWSTTLYGTHGMHQLRRAQNRFYSHLPVEAKRASA